MTVTRLGCLPGAVVKVRVPRGPGAVEGKGELLVVLVLLTPHPESREHLLQRKQTAMMVNTYKRGNLHRTSPSPAARPRVLPGTLIQER